ncbi:phytanoyl-CoA dioxygenase family protein [Spongiibacter marinus]|uniref:phytanoyl-CoA dioxygenase family protein n=1 Tax=Spongiibacter marinus TaxID=354246 RepID=UPI003C68C8BE
MKNALTQEQIDHYHENGFVCPVDVLSPIDVARLRGELEGMEQLQGHAMDRAQCNKSYLLYDWADELVHHPAIVDAVESLIGPDILCYMTNLFIKEAGSPSYVSMHQDAAYWGVDADDVVTAWVALSPATQASGVMKVQPGSHKTTFEQVNTYGADNLLTRGQEIPANNLDESQQVYMELQPGQMSLHHFMLAHGSDANTSDDRRIGLAIRYVNASANKIGMPESALLVRGQNKGGFLLETRARELNRKQRITQHAQALRRQVRNVFAPDSSTALTERVRLNLTTKIAVLATYARQLRASIGG